MIETFEVSKTSKGSVRNSLFAVRKFREIKGRFSEDTEI